MTLKIPGSWAANPTEMTEGTDVGVEGSEPAGPLRVVVASALGSGANAAPYSLGSGSVANFVPWMGVV
jgi:hypothetical protein